MTSCDMIWLMEQRQRKTGVYGTALARVAVEAVRSVLEERDE